MSGIFETKNKILKSLSGKPKTWKQLADELGLTQATLTQHLHELEQKGLVRESESSYSKRWKYYEVNAPAYERFTMSSNMMRSAAATFLIAIAVIVVALAAIGTVAHHNASLSTATNSMTSAVTSNSGTTSSLGMIIPVSSAGAAFACPFMGYSQRNVTINNISGFKQYTVQNFADIVIAPGSRGMINYTIDVAPIAQNEHSNLTLNVFNNVIFTHRTTSNSTTSYATPGISVTLIPSNYSEPYPSSAESFKFSILFNVSSSAANGTYWMRIANCEGNSAPMLVTVGSAPYNGTVIVPPGVYA